MDLNVNTDKRITETKDVSLTPAQLDTLWNIFKSMDINLPIHSMEARIKFDGAIIYWLRFISEKS
jgi:hypothetical protein